MTIQHLYVAALNHRAPNVIAAELIMAKADQSRIDQRCRSEGRATNELEDASWNQLDEAINRLTNELRSAVFARCGVPADQLVELL